VPKKLFRRISLLANLERSENSVGISDIFVSGQHDWLVWSPLMWHIMSHNVAMLPVHSLF
jgi:hypothetical protein